MSTNQVLRQGMYEGINFIFLKAGEAMGAFDCVMLDPDNAGKVLKCTTTGTPFGFVAQPVTTTGVADYEPGGLAGTNTAKVGDVVGVYICGGVYNVMTTLAWAAVVYAGTSTAGKLSASESTSKIKVGQVVHAGNSTNGVPAKIKSYL